VKLVLRSDNVTLPTFTLRCYVTLSECSTTFTYKWIMFPFCNNNNNDGNRSDRLFNKYSNSLQQITKKYVTQNPLPLERTYFMNGPIPSKSIKSDDKLNWVGSTNHLSGSHLLQFVAVEIVNKLCHVRHVSYNQRLAGRLFVGLFPTIPLSGIKMRSMLHGNYYSAISKRCGNYLASVKFPKDILFEKCITGVTWMW